MSDLIKLERILALLSAAKVDILTLDRHNWKFLYAMDEVTEVCWKIEEEIDSLKEKGSEQA